MQEKRNVMGRRGRWPGSRNGGEDEAKGKDGDEEGGGKGRRGEEAVRGGGGAEDLAHKVATEGGFG
jgi:hypothetical protein